MIEPKKLERKKFVIYTRCSTDDQAKGDFTTLDAQAHHCKNMLDALGYELADFGKKGIVADDGYSGKDLNRLGIQSVLTNIQQKKFDGIIFFRLDRLTRNPRDLYGLIDLFKENEIDFISVRENLDSSSALGRVVIGIIGLLSAFERELTGERVKASAIARARQGLWVCGKVPFGYKRIKDGNPLPNGHQPKKIIVDDTIGPKLRLIWEMASDNKPLSEIGSALTVRGVPSPEGGIWRKQTLCKLVKNPFYKGIIHYSGETHRGKHPALIEDPLWEQANRILTAHLPGHRFNKQPKEYFVLLKSLVRCGKCGSYMVNSFGRGKSGKAFYYYECSLTRQKLGCNALRLSASALDQAVIQFFKRASNDQDIIVNAIGNAVLDSRDKLSKVQKEIKTIEKKLTTVKESAGKLLNLAMENEIPKGTVYREKMDAFEVEIGILQDKLNRIETKRKASEMSANAGEYLYSNIRSAMESLDEAPAEAQHALLKALIKTVTIHDDHVEMRLYVENSLKIPTKAKCPTEKNREAPDAQVCLPERPSWRPSMD